MTPTSAPKVVVLDTVVPVTEEPHRNEKRMKWFPITRMYFKVYSVVRALQIAVKCLLVLLNVCRMSGGISTRFFMRQTEIVLRLHAMFPPQQMINIQFVRPR